MSYGSSGPPHRPPNRRRDDHYFPMEHANSIPPYHPATFGPSNPRFPFQPTPPQIQPPFPSPQYVDTQDPAPFAMQWNVSSPNPPSSIGSGFPSPGDYGSYPASPSQFPVPSTTHVPLDSIYHPSVAFPEPHGARLPSGPGPYAPVLPTRIQSLSSFIAPTIQMPEPQPSIVPPYPEYMQQQQHQQQHMWGQDNLAYQNQGHSRTDSYARDQAPAGYNASAPGSRVPPAHFPEDDYSAIHDPSLNRRDQQAPAHAQSYTENHRERLSQRQPPAFAREHNRPENHRSPASRPQSQEPIPEQSRLPNNYPLSTLRVPPDRNREREQHLSSASQSEQRQNEHLRPPSSPRSSPAHSVDRRQSQLFRPSLSPRSAGSDAPPSYTSSPQFSTASPRPYAASPPGRPSLDSSRTADVDALSNQVQHGMNFNLQPPPPGRANGSRLSGTTMNGASASSASNVDRSERRFKNERLSASQKENYRPDFAYGGMKKALLIGINYTGTRHQLEGCINDVLRTHRFLIEHGGYKKKEIVILTDDSGQPERLPTRDNIIRCMKALVESAERDDTFFLHFSGHGAQIPDLDDDEDDGMDETIRPLDFERNGDIVDDELHRILVKPLPKGCRLTALIDSCHSGTILDLPYMYSLHRNTGSVALNVSRKGLNKDKATISDVISFSGCMDAETGEDGTRNGLDVGAMSWAFTNVLSRKPEQTYRELLNNIRQEIKSRCQQTPLLSASHQIDPNKIFAY